ncbi:MAG TPA: TfoX/Sxy family protein [Gemmatimonadaceae bacterium]|jgi:TfoX/Sxy family transcriptional regulator of competence genes|nr:TfoX/Sxy family protein [Gemmatimonadaceae bacterium]
MATDYDLAAGVRAALADAGAVREVKMFGGIGFMLNGNLVAGASKRGLLVRVGKDSQRKALTRPGARPMVMRGRTMADYIYVDPPALSDRSVRAWLTLALGFVRTLPPKTKAPTKGKTKAKTKTKTKRVE